MALGHYFNKHLLSTIYSGTTWLKTEWWNACSHLSSVPREALSAQQMLPTTIFISLLSNCTGVLFPVLIYIPEINFPSVCDFCILPDGTDFQQIEDRMLGVVNCTIWSTCHPWNVLEWLVSMGQLWDRSSPEPANPKVQQNALVPATWEIKIHADPGRQKASCMSSKLQELICNEALSPWVAQCNPIQVRYSRGLLILRWLVILPSNTGGIK